LAAAKGNRDLLLFNALAIFQWALDSGDIPTADLWDRYANALLEDHVLKLADLVLSESACFDLLHREHVRSAVSKLRTVADKTLPPLVRHRNEAILQLTEGHEAQALSSIQHARACLSAALPSSEFERTILGLLATRATQSRSESPSARLAARNRIALAETIAFTALSSLVRAALRDNYRVMKQHVQGWSSEHFNSSTFGRSVLLTARF
jgi:hypothetical protein